MIESQMYEYFELYGDRAYWHDCSLILLGDIAGPKDLIKLQKFRINGIVYNEFSEDFENAYNKEKLWAKLQQKEDSSRHD